MPAYDWPADFGIFYAGTVPHMGTRVLYCMDKSFDCYGKHRYPYIH